MPTTNQTTISLNRIRAIDIRDGGWNISLADPPALEAGQAILLEVGPDGPCVDITDGYSKPHMPLLLEALALRELWAQHVSCRALLVKFGGYGCRPVTYYRTGTWGHLPITPQTRGITVLAESRARTLVSPVKPYCSPNPALKYGWRALVQLGNATPRIFYKWRWGTVDGVEKKVGDGRTLTPSINGRYYFMNQYPEMNTPFVTDNNERGLDCTTYILTAYNVLHRYQGGDGADVAQCLLARNCGVANWTGTELQRFFHYNRQGEFVMWKPGRHVVMVHDRFVHEYTTDDVYGYRCSTLEQYLQDNADTNFCVQSLPGTNTVRVAKPAPPPKKAPQPGVGAPQPGSPAPPNPGGNPLPNYITDHDNRPSYITGHRS